MHGIARVAVCLLTGLVLVSFVEGQAARREYRVPVTDLVEISNETGWIHVVEAPEEIPDILLTASSDSRFPRSAIGRIAESGRTRISVSPGTGKRRIDLNLRLPKRSRIRLLTVSGEINVSGNFSRIHAESTTGTIFVDVPTDDLTYKFLWLGSRPRFLSDIPLEKAEERNAGKFVIEGHYGSADGAGDAGTTPPKQTGDTVDEKAPSEGLRLELRTLRGIILLNVDPAKVPSSLRERPLTEAAKAIIRGGDILLTEAIRRASPKFFGDYAATLPPRRKSPRISDAATPRLGNSEALLRVTVQVTDENNRAITGLKKDEFLLMEAGREVEVTAVEPTTAPFDLVLLLDVSGSVENYVDFIRKAARSFVNTIDAGDRVSIVTFNDDATILSGFSTDKDALSESLDTFDAGGGTAYYDSLGFVLAEVLRPLKGGRTAIVALSDGDDNRSFLPFSTLLGSLQESGALVYPLYVPTGVIAGASKAKERTAVDPLRERFLAPALTSRATTEGETLARVSGGVFYPIGKLSDIQRAYDDIVLQLRTAYTITYKARRAAADSRPAIPRIRVRVKGRTAFVKVGEAVRVPIR